MDALRPQITGRARFGVTRCDPVVRVTGDAAVAGIGDVDRNEAARPLEPDERIGAPVDLAEVEPLGLGTLVVEMQGRLRILVRDSLRETVCCSLGCSFAVL